MEFTLCCNNSQIITKWADGKVDSLVDFSKMSLVAHQFGRVEYIQYLLLFFFKQVQLEKSKQIFDILNSKF